MNYPFRFTKFFQMLKRGLRELAYYGVIVFSVSEISADDIAEHKFIPLTEIPLPQLIL